MDPSTLNGLHFCNHGLTNQVGIDADKLYPGFPYYYHMWTAYPCDSFLVNWGDSNYYGGQFYGTHTNTNPGTYTIQATAWHNGNAYVTQLTVTASNTPKLTPDPNTGRLIYGPYNMYNQLVFPDSLRTGTLYKTGLHIYHPSDSTEDNWNGNGFDTHYGVRYSVNWGDGTDTDCYDVLRDGAGTEYVPTHVYSTEGTYTITAMAGWYPINFPNYITWSEPTTLTVNGF